MENYVAGQLAALGAAVALGVAGGLVYDLRGCCAAGGRG